MSHGLLPTQSEVTFEPRENYTLKIDEAAAADVFDALRSDTRCEIIKHLYSEPMTASQLESITEMSIQNVTYHLQTLEDADLVEVVDTWYSSRGREMAVYAPRVRSLVIDCRGADDRDT